MTRSLMTTKQFSRHTPQPPEGYFPLTCFTPFSFHPTGVATTAYREENLHPGVVGLIVNSLIRYLLSGDRDKSFNFAFRKGRGTCDGKERKSVRLLLNDINGLTPETVYAARQLARYIAGLPKRDDTRPTCDETLPPAVPPDDYTVACIISMVEDTVAFFQQQTVQSVFSVFSMTERFRIITGNEHSVVADNTLWKSHVSFRDPDKKDTLRLMATAVLAQAKAGITRAGIVNVRLRKAYVCDLNNPCISASLQCVTNLMKQSVPEGL